MNEAAWEFCDKKYINEYPEDYKNLLKIRTEAPESFLIGISEVLASFNASKRNMDDHSLRVKSAINNIQNNLFDKIINGKLIALGFRSPIESDLPMWPPKEIDIKESAISTNGIDFVKVRIIKDAVFKQMKNKLSNGKDIPLPKIKVKDNKAGRPSLKNQIIAAYDYLKKENRIDYTKFLKSHTELIQQTVQKLYPQIKDTNGMEHEAIRRAISPIFKADKKTSKSTSKL